ncbi:MAG TPA: AI-2E family transporter [Ramlibacter sp.]|nr:AI-2E family transporter [Ramlibacter sp.]
MQNPPPLAAEQMRLRSILAFAALLLGVLWLHLLSALYAGLAGYALYRAVRHYTGPAHSWRKRLLRWVIISAAVLLLIGTLLWGFDLLFRSGGLTRLMELLADTLDQLRATAPGWVVERLPESAEAVRRAVSEWLRSHAGEVQRWGGEALKILVHIIIGLAVGLMAAAAKAPHPHARRPLVLHAIARMEHLAASFANVIAAQLRISLINTVLTALYLLVLLPALGYKVPLAATLVGFTFFAALLPIVGNLLSNAAITVAALTVSVWLGIASLGFLVVIHKLEYFLNARIVGTHTNVPTYGMLAAMLVLEASFGVAGLVAAPIYAAWLTRELREGEWV